MANPTRSNDGDWSMAMLLQQLHNDVQQLRREVERAKSDSQRSNEALSADMRAKNAALSDELSRLASDLTDMGNRLKPIEQSRSEFRKNIAGVFWKIVERIAWMAVAAAAVYVMGTHWPHSKAAPPDPPAIYQFP